MTAPLLDRALGAIDGYSERTAALEAIEARVAVVSKTPPVDLTAQTEAALLAGDGLPDDLTDRLADADHANRLRLAELSFLGRRHPTNPSGLYGKIHHDRAALVAAGVDDALAVLRGELVEIVAAVREVDGALGVLRSAESAVAAGGDTSDAWRRLGDLVERYTGMRLAQLKLLEAAGRDRVAAARLLEVAGYLRDLDAHDPAIAARRRGEAAPEHILLTRTPWPAPRLTLRSGPWPTHDRPAYLRWAVTVAEPWLPSLGELDARADELADADAEAAHLRVGGKPGERPLVRNLATVGERW